MDAPNKLKSLLKRPKHPEMRVSYVADEGRGVDFGGDRLQSHCISKIDEKRSRFVEIDGNRNCKGDTLETVRPKVRKRVRFQLPPESSSDSDSEADWETDGEEEDDLRLTYEGIRDANSLSKKLRRKPTKSFETLFNPMNFGYVNLSQKILGSYAYSWANRRNKEQKRKEKYSRKGPEGEREEVKSGGDVDLPPHPELTFQDDKGGIFVGINDINGILNADDLSISQKYRSLGVEEDPFDEELNQEGSSWSAWLSYKFNRAIHAQWPFVWNFPQSR